MAALPGLGVLASKAIFFGALPRGRGGLCTPARKASRQPQHCPLLGHRLIVNAPVGMRCLGLSPALHRGRGDRVPPRKTPLASSRSPLPQGHPSSDSPPRGGEGSARPLAGLCFLRKIAPLGHQPFARPSVIMTSPGLRPARICGRGDRVPPRKSPFASSPAPTPLGHPPPIVHPRGGAGSARPRGRHPPHQGISPLGRRPFAHASG